MNANERIMARVTVHKLLALPAASMKLLMCNSYQKNATPATLCISFGSSSKYTHLGDFGGAIHTLCALNK